jgi:hypothetical protein
MVWQYDEEFDKASKPKFNQELDDKTSLDNIYKLIVAISFAIAVIIGSVKK